LHLTVALIVAVFSAITISTIPASAESNGGVRVMPLGDSITDGLTVPGGYRIDLWQKLVADRYRVDFVGSLSNGPSSLGDHDHEGHSGWTIAQVDANVVNWLRNTTPRTVLLHIGTNDMFANSSGAASRLSTLIDHITTTAPAADLFVATIIPLSGADTQVRAYNAAIPGIVAAKASAGKHVHLVDMYSALTLGDLADGVHPNAGGYRKMADVWYRALQSVPGTIGDPSQPTTPPTTPPAGGNCTASITPGTVWGDRYNTSVTVAGSAWTVTIAITAPQRVSTTWSGTFAWSGGGNTMTVKPNGSGNTFGFTTMTNGNSGARPRITSCIAGS
jgi:lysophospholipase L1-like esterase